MPGESEYYLYHFQAQPHFSSKLMLGRVCEWKGKNASAVTIPLQLSEVTVVLTLLKCVIREFLYKNYFLHTTKLLGANPNVSKG